MDEAGELETWIFSGKNAFTQISNWYQIERDKEFHSKLGKEYSAVGTTDIFAEKGEKVCILCKSITNAFNVYIANYSVGDPYVKIDKEGFFEFIAEKDGYVEIQSTAKDFSVNIYLENALLDYIKNIDDFSKQQAENIEEKSDAVVKNNIALGGDFKSLEYWNTTGVITEEGLSVSKKVNEFTFASSKDTKNVSQGDKYVFLLDVTNNADTPIKINFLLAAGAKTYCSKVVENIKKGRNIVCDETSISNISGNDANIFINNTANQTADIIIHSLIVIKDTTISEIYKLYTELGYSPKYNIVNFAQFCGNAPSQEEFNELYNYVHSNKIVHELFAYFNNDSGVSDNPENGIFVGYDEDINALQRAINSIPDDTTEDWIIYVEGNLIITDFSKMSAPDKFGRNYKAAISLVGKKNIDIIGRNGKPQIFANLPGSGAPLNYQYYQTISFEGDNIHIRNLSFKIKNGRYALHYETNSTQIPISYKAGKVYAENCDFIHLGNSDTAWEQWKSTTGAGIGFTGGGQLNFDACFFTSIGGHDGYNDEKGEINLLNCIAETWNFNQFGKVNSQSKYKMMGCNIKHIIVNKTLNTGNIGYARILGFSNLPAIITAFDTNCYPQFSDVTSKFIAKEVISKGCAINISGRVSKSSHIYAISLEDAEIGETFKAVRNTYLSKEQLKISDDFDFSDGMYLQSNSAGEIIQSEMPTNCKCVNIDGILYALIGQL